MVSDSVQKEGRQPGEKEAYRQFYLLDAGQATKVPPSDRRIYWLSVSTGKPSVEAIDASVYYPRPYVRMVPDGIRSVPTVGQFREYSERIATRRFGRESQIPAASRE